jgi:hypothetical protein
VVSGSLSRNVQYVEYVAAPLLAEALSFGVNGSFTNRLQFGAGMGASKGQYGSLANDPAAPGSGSRYDAFFGSARLSFAMNRYISIAGDYSYSGLNGQLPMSASGQLHPHAVRFYVQLWAPLIVRNKR